MWMATRSNSGFLHDDVSMRSRHAISFQTTEVVPIGPNGSSSWMNMIDNATNQWLIQTGRSSNSSIDSVSSEWSNEEQFKLEDGLEKYNDRPSITRYIKIAATLPDKTVRDVALRCRWLTRKRRKSEELNRGNRKSSSKDKQAELCSRRGSSIPFVLPDSMASYPFLMPITSSSEHVTCQDLSGHAINLLEQNIKAFGQIRANLSSYKAEDNIDLFRQTRNNLITIQNDMNHMPGLMSHMPPLPVAVSDDLLTRSI